MYDGGWGGTGHVGKWVFALKGVVCLYVSLLWTTDKAFATADEVYTSKPVAHSPVHNLHGCPVFSEPSHSLPMAVVPPLFVINKSSGCDRTVTGIPPANWLWLASIMMCYRSDTCGSSVESKKRKGWTGMEVRNIPPLIYTCQIVTSTLRLATSAHVPQFIYKNRVSKGYIMNFWCSLMEADARARYSLSFHAKSVSYWFISGFYLCN